MKTTIAMTIAVSALFVEAAAALQPAAWSQPTAPFRITDNIYYVGTKGLSSYLIAGSGGLIVLDATLDRNVAAIEKNIRVLGFEVTDVKLIINSHAHYDHAAGTARLKRQSGAQVAAMAGDVSSLENGRHEGDNTHGMAVYPPVKVDQVLADRDRVSVGDVSLVATATPGHTRGCTTWSLDSMDGDVLRRVVFPCSLTVAGNVLVGNKSYPGIVEDYRASFDRLEAMQADIVLPAHPEFTDLFDRKQRRDVGDSEAFVDTDLLAELVARSRKAFETQLAKEQKRK